MSDYNHINLSPELKSITAHFREITNNFAQIRDDIRELKIRGDNEELGIYIYEVINEHSITRALQILAGRSCRALEEISNEMRNPTTLPVDE